MRVPIYDVLYSLDAEYHVFTKKHIKKTGRPHPSIFHKYRDKDNPQKQSGPKLSKVLPISISSKIFMKIIEMKPERKHAPVKIVESLRSAPALLPLKTKHNMHYVLFSRMPETTDFSVIIRFLVMFHFEKQDIIEHIECECPVLERVI